MTTYNTISEATEGLYKEKGSRFLSFAIPVRDEQEAKEVVQRYKKLYHDARHVCYAYRCLDNERCSDDGEPSGTAGQPILRQLQAQDLRNLIVIVVRYFGGILLGTGGLIVAYREATQDALGQAEVVVRPILERRILTVPYPELSALMRTIRDTGTTIVEQGYTDTGDAQLTLDIPRSQITRFE